VDVGEAALSFELAKIVNGIFPCGTQHEGECRTAGGRIKQELKEEVWVGESGLGWNGPDALRGGKSGRAG
jgi:hypothetical protein